MPSPFAKASPFAPMPLTRARLTPPRSADFTATGVLTSTDKTDRLACSVTSASNNVRLLLRAIPATPYTIDFAGMSMGQPWSANDLANVGIVLADATPKLVCMVGPTNDTGLGYVRAARWNTPTSFSASVYFNAAQINFGLFFLRITDDGTTRKFLWSNNGRDFMQVASEATNSFLTPTQYGMFFYNTNAAGLAIKQVVYHFLLTPGILGDEP